MKFKQGLLHARSTIVFLLSFGLSVGAIFAIDNWRPAAPDAASLWPKESAGIPSQVQRDLSDSEMDAARIDKALTANTNAIALESLCFKKFGRLLDLR